MDYTVKTAFTATDKVSSELKKMQANTTSFSKNAQSQFKVLSRSAGLLKGAFRSVAQGIGIGSGIALFQKFSDTVKSSIDLGVEFEQTMINAAAKITDDMGKPVRQGTKDFEGMVKAARNVGKTTKYSAIEAAQALDFIAQAGYNAKESVALLPRVVDLALASNTNFEQSAYMATSTLGMYNLKVKDTIQLEKSLSRINDVMALTANATNLSVTDLFETFRQSASLGSSIGVTMEQLAAMAGSIADVAKGETAGVYLKNMFTGLLAPSKQVQGILSDLGIKIQDSKGDFLNIFDILQQFKDKTKDMGTAKRGGILAKVFGERAVIAVTKMMSTGIDSVRDMEKQMLNAGGSAKTMAEIMQNSVGGSLAKLKAAAQSVVLSLFSIGDSDFKDIIDSLTKIVRKVDDWVNANKELIGKQFAEIRDYFKNWMKSVDDKSIKNFFDTASGAAIDFLDILKITATTLRFLAKMVVFLAKPFKISKQLQNGEIKPEDLIEQKDTGLSGILDKKIKEWRAKPKASPMDGMLAEKMKQAREDFKMMKVYENTNGTGITAKETQPEVVKKFQTQETINNEQKQINDNYLHINFNNQPDTVNVNSDIKAKNIKLNRGKSR